MALDFLTKEYYLTNGEYNDPILKNLECSEQAYYLILKNAFKAPGELYYFLDDINMLTAVAKDNKINDLWINWAGLNKRFFILEHKKCKGYKALLLLENFLDQGEMVLVQTVPNLLSFYHNYNPGFDLRDFKPHHYFLVLHHDKEHIYYVDEPTVIIEKNFVPYAGNPQIGVYKKEDLLHPFSHYCQLATMRHKTFPGFSVKDYLHSQFYRMIGNYKWKPVRLPWINYFMGRSALQYLRSLCGKSYPLLDTKTAAPSGIDHHDLLLWKIEVIRKRKSILEQCISAYLGEKYPIGVLENSYEAWGLFAVLLSRRYHKGRMQFDRGLIKYMDQIIELEDRLMLELGKLI